MQQGDRDHQHPQPAAEQIRTASVASPGCVQYCLKLEQQLLTKGNHDVYLADQFPGVGDVEGWVEVYQVG